MGDPLSELKRDLPEEGDAATAEDDRPAKRHHREGPPEDVATAPVQAAAAGAELGPAGHDE
eukprot:8883147-Alexandrium_andersonii.AAC.1